MIPMKAQGNKYNLQELAGAFGDLGTLIPFLMGYIILNRMNPVGILTVFGFFKIIMGLYYKTPIPVQPMKLIGAAVISHPGAITPGAVWVSGLFTGILWLILGLTDAVTWISRITSRPVIQGLILGLGLGFMREGIKMMETDLLLAWVAAILTFILLSQQRIPAMLLLLGSGFILAIVREPVLLKELDKLSFRFQLPEFTLYQLRWEDFLTGILILGIPQAALTLSNAIIAIVEENNTLFPDRPITVRTVAIDHGIMNLIGASFGGVPMCHGAGGMAGHVRFGARTGGALIILGGLLLFTGLFLADSIAILFKLFPRPILGVILLFGGLELAVRIPGIQGHRFQKGDLYVMILTAGISLVNIGIGYLVGLFLWYAFQGKWLKV
jgi:MFS superfamily sulfate permease-like transporter